jgi:putative transposase
MKLPRSTYYYKPKQNKPDDSSLLKRIEELVEEFHRYGYRRITAQLHREGIPVNHKKVLRLMRERGLLCKTRRRWVRTTDSTHGYRIYPNLLPQGPVNAPNRVWIADLTYIRIFIGFVYLAVILDLFSRKAIGYGLSRNIDTQLSLKALHMALQRRNPPPGVIHHSDQGVRKAF